jgi:hypothetical protein
MSGIHEITINDIESRDIERPGQPKLRICAVGDEVFLTIVDQRDTNLTYTATPIAEVAVHLEDLKAALGLVTDWKA